MERSLCVLLVSFLVLLTMNGCSSARIFTFKSNKTGEVSALLDLHFMLTLAIWKDGYEIYFTQLTDNDVSRVNLNEPDVPYFRSLDLIFDRVPGVEQCRLSYVFYLDGNTVMAHRDVVVNGSSAFYEMTSSLTHIPLIEEGNRPKIVGDPRRPYLCDYMQTVSFRQSSVEHDQLTYKAELTTYKIRTQVFNVQDGVFTPGTPSVCKPPTTKSHSKSFVTDGKTAGIAAGSTVLVVVVVVVVVVALVAILIYRSTNKKCFHGDCPGQKYEKFGQSNLQYPAVITWDTKQADPKQDLKATESPTILKA